jgi:hypothetical protein
MTRARQVIGALVTIVVAAAMLALLVVDAQAQTPPTVADSHVIPPHRTWKPQNVASPVVGGPGLPRPLRLYSGGVRLARACPAGYFEGTSSCRYHKTRPRSACRAVCPVMAVIPGWGALRIKNVSDQRVRVEFRRYLPCPECGE